MGCSNNTYGLCINQGATFSQEFLLSTIACSTAIGASSSPVDLTGYTANLQIRPYAESTTLYYDASIDISLGGSAGSITIVIPAFETAGFTWFNGVYTLLLTDPNGVVEQVLSGTVTVCPWVTQGVSPQFGWLLEDESGFFLTESSAYFELEAGP